MYRVSSNTKETTMTMRAGWTINGKHFCETWTTRRGAPTLLCFIDGKPIARAKYLVAREEARQAEAAKQEAA
jgi:hypothetical protein